MKKYLPFILLSLGILVLIAGFVFLRNKGKTQVEEENVVAEIPFEKRPFTSLIPSQDGHWLKLKMDGIGVDAALLDYEFLYKLPDGRTQGVPGTVQLEGSKQVERDIPLGSESSGEYTYNEGVENGTLVLRFRDSKGKLVGKLISDFHLQKSNDVLTSPDGKFKYEFDKTPRNGFFVVMNTFGAPQTFSKKIENGPIGVFSSLESELAGTVKMDGTVLYELVGESWQKLEEGKAEDLGIFISSNE